MIHLDTSVIIDVFSGEKPLAPRLRELLDGGERISFSMLVLFEWRRGRRMSEQIDVRRRYSHRAKPFPSERRRRFWHRISTRESNDLGEGKPTLLLPHVPSLTKRSFGR